MLSLCLGLKTNMKNLLLFLVFFSCLSFADTEDPDFNIPIDIPEDDGNTQNGDLNTNNQNSNNNNRTTTNIGAGAGEPTPVNTAIAPSLMSSGSDTCLKSLSGGMQVLTLGASAGKYTQDEECNRRRDAKVFKDLGMIIPAISRMCQNKDNWEAMFVAGNPCPILVKGKMVFGKNAVLAMRSQPDVYIPDYTNKKTFYDTVLGIGEVNETDQTDGDDNISISERFRSSVSRSSELD